MSGTGWQGCGWTGLGKDRMHGKPLEDLGMLLPHPMLVLAVCFETFLDRIENVGRPVHGGGETRDSRLDPEHEDQGNNDREAHITDDPGEIRNPRGETRAAIARRFRHGH